MSTIKFELFRDKTSWFISFFIILIFCLLVFFQADKKFVLDEIDFPIVSKATSDTGLPVYYRGEKNPHHLGLYHPPLYIYIQSLFVKIFGFNEKTIRFFGMLCTIITSILSLMILKIIYEKKYPNILFKSNMGNFFLALFLLNPYTIANATLPDIDSTILPIVITLFVYVSLLIIPKINNADRIIAFFLKNKFGILILSLFYSLALWTKLTTPVILPVLVFLFMLCYGFSLMKSMLITVTCFVFGLLLFIITFYSYTSIFDLPFDYTFSFLLHSFSKGTSSEGGMAISILLNKIFNNFTNIKFFLHWITLPTVILILFGVFSLIKKKFDKGDLILSSITIFSLFVFIFYFGLISPFGGFFKYPFPIMQFLFLPIIVFLSYNMIPNDRFKIFTYIVFFLVGFCFNYFFYKDSVFKLGIPVSTCGIVFILFTCIIMFILSKQNYIDKKYLVFSTMCLVVFSLGNQLSISRIQAISGYPTKYHYGQTGFDDTIEYLRSKTEKNEVIWAMKDIGYYVNNKYIENYGYFFVDSLQEDLISLLKEKQVRYYVVTKDIGQDRIDGYPKIKKIFDLYAIKDAEIGNFVVYRCKGI